jgi:hypothetical protein
MATAEKVPTNYKVTLTLNQNEAETLRILLRKIGGNPKTTRRRFVDNISFALNNAGVGCVEAKFNPFFGTAIWFDIEDVKDNA